MLAAPRPISSWSGSIRCRFLAASVCATETDSTNPMTEINSAGSSRRPISSVENEGSVSGGSPCGTTPTILTPTASSPRLQTTAVVTTTARTGPAFVTISAKRGLRPRRQSIGFIPLRTQNRNPVAPIPITSVIQFVADRFSASETTISGRVSPPALTPRICLIWLVAIRMPDAVMKPAMTGCDRKLARNPSFKSPIASRIAPDSPARVRAATA